MIEFRSGQHAVSSPPLPLSNAQIADRLASLAQLLSAKNENAYRVKAYQRAAAKIRNLSESLHELVRDNEDLTRFAGIGEAIAGAVREIVLTGTLHKLELLRSQAPAELAGIRDFPRLDPKRVARVYKKLQISSIEQLREKLESGEIQRLLGFRMAQHVRQGLTETHEILLYRADELRTAVEGFLLDRCGVRVAEAAGAFRRREEIVKELEFVIQTDDFASVVSKLKRFGGSMPLVSSSKETVAFALPAGILLCVHLASPQDWGYSLFTHTGSREHLKKVAAHAGGSKALKAKGPFPTEAVLYEALGMVTVPPELRSGHDEIERALAGRIPQLVTVEEIRGELHAHSTSSDGSHSIEEMAAAARERDYEYIGITDHSQSLRIARGLSVEDLRQQVRYIAKLNERLDSFRVLKAAEVDILADGSLDYPDDLLQELDYTVCSIHSRFGLGKEQQTERIMRAMDNRRFNILGHATGRLLLKRPGYDIDFGRIARHARENGCFFEINSSPDRLDLSAENARIAAGAGVKIAITTDAHSTREFGLIRSGIDQARRAGLDKENVLNCMRWYDLAPLFKR